MRTQISTYVAISLLSMIFLLNTQDRLISLKEAQTHEYTIRNALSAYSAGTRSWQETKRIIIKAINNGITTVDIQEHGVNGITPLYLALSMSDAPFTQFLLERNADPNFSFSGIPIAKPLFAVNKPELAQMLINYGAKIDIRNINGNDLLHTAIGCAYPVELFNYYLTLPLNPTIRNTHNGNLWHTLIDQMTATHHYCTTASFKSRISKLKLLANQLNTHELSPTHKDASGKNAIQKIEDHITKQETKAKTLTNQIKEGIATTKQVSQLRQLDEIIRRLKIFKRLMLEPQESLKNIAI